MYVKIPASSPPPPTQTKIASSAAASVCLKISTATVPCPAMTYGSSNGGMLVRPWSVASRAHSRFAASKSEPKRTTLAPRRSTLRYLIEGVLRGMTIVQAIPSSWPARATPWAWLPAERGSVGFEKAKSWGPGREQSGYCYLGELRQRGRTLVRVLVSSPPPSSFLQGKPIPGTKSSSQARY